MKNRYSFKKAVVIFSTAAVFMGTGIFGTAVTAWADPSEGTVISDGINVRTSAVDGDTIDTLTSGKEVTIVDTTTGSDGLKWYQIEYTSSGQTFTGWVRGDLVESEDAETEAETAEAEAQQAAEEAGEAEEEAQTAEEEAEQAEESKEDEETTKPAETTAQAVTLAVANSIPADVVPDGFKQTTVTYEGRDVPALEMNNAEVYLLYMEDTSHQTDGRLVVYDMSKSELIPYISFSTDDGFILLLNIPDAELSAVSDRFAKTVCEFDTGTMDALQMTQKDSVISESADIEDFYYMYGVNRDGSYGWYTYNAAEGTIQESILSMHYNLNGTSVDVEEKNSSFSLDSLSMIVIVGIIVIFLLLIILVIIFGVRYRQLAKEKDGKGNRRGGGGGDADFSEPAAQSEPDSNDFYDSAEDPYAGRTESFATEQGVHPIQTPEPTSQPTPEPTSQPTPEPTSQPTPEPMSQRTPQPTPEPTPTPAKKPADTVTGTPDPDDDDLEFL